MQAEGIRAGDRYDVTDDRGRVRGGWTATGDAVIDGSRVYVPVRQHDGRESTRSYAVGEHVDLTFGAGPVKYCEHCGCNSTRLCVCSKDCQLH